MERGEPVEPVYSVNTGFGSLAGREAFTDPRDAAELSRRLVISNASGVGTTVDAEVVRATMLIRMVSLLQGHSAVGAAVIETLVDMLNRGVLPAVPEYGSLGASGDLIPLAHIALVLCRPSDAEDDERDSGEAVLDGRVVSGKEAMAAAGVPRIPLGAKDGLALLNGTSFSCAQTALAVHDAANPPRASRSASRQVRRDRSRTSARGRATARRPTGRALAVLRCVHRRERRPLGGARPAARRP